MPQTDKDHQHQRRRVGGQPTNLLQGVSSTTKSLRRYRERKEQQFVRKASSLRQYRKAMKKEGYEAGRGGARKRPREGGGAATSNESTDVARKKRRKKADPLAAARRKAEEAREERERSSRDRDERKVEEVEKEKERKRKHFASKRRTKKGQPIMADMIKGMLGKLQSESK